MCRQRLTPAAFSQAIPLAQNFGPEHGVEAGILDRVVDAGDLVTVVAEVATALSGLDMGAHATNKRRTREQALAAVRAAVEAEFPS